MNKEIGGIVSIIIGVILTFYGISYSNSAKSQLYNGASNFVNDMDGQEVLAKDNTGLIIIIGLALILLGGVLIYLYEDEKKGAASNNTSTENDTNIVKNNTAYSYTKSFTNNEVNNENYGQVIENLSKNYNLYKNKIYNEQEYTNKKNEWIDRLRKMKFQNIEDDFLYDLLPLIKENALNSEDLSNIKYILFRH